MKDIDTDLRKIADRIVNAKVHYDIWDALQRHRSQKESVEVMTPYWNFFRYSIEAHFNSFIIELYSLLESRKDTVNIPRTINKIKEKMFAPEAAICAIEILFKEVKELWVKIGIIRNESVCHFSNKKTKVQVYSAAAISPDDVELLFSKFVKLFNNINYLCVKSIDSFNLNGGDHTNALLDTLLQNKRNLG